MWAGTDTPSPTARRRRGKESAPATSSPFRLTALPELARVRLLSSAIGLGWRPRRLRPNVLVWTDRRKRWIIIQESSCRACNYLITSYFGRWISEGGTHKALTFFALGSCIIALKVGNKIHEEQHRKRSVEAWCFNSWWAQEKEGEGVSPAGQASM